MNQPFKLKKNGVGGVRTIIWHERDRTATERAAADLQIDKTSMQYKLCNILKRRTEINSTQINNVKRQQV